jgi:methylaspartate mutase epsilon subunit
LCDQKFPDCKELQEELTQIKKEVCCLMDAVLKVGNGDLAQGVVNAFKQGLIDVPFAPSKYNAGLILPARDNDGYIRILEFGNLAFTDEIKQFHKQKIEERAKAESRTVSFQFTIDDIYAVSLGHIVGRPNYGEF